ncbi:MAG: DUF4065 domain-containing protein [Alphaproteobacteria bacterium]|nr:DUF4065 domain-containing protein [Alphaproteobacteria bacterium]
MGYSAKEIANFFLERYSKYGITPLKLQKLIYIAHGWCLGLYDIALVWDEYAEAWEYGPVFPSIYHEFKEFGRGPISRMATEIKMNENYELVEKTPKIKKQDKETRRLLERIWEIHGDHSGLFLSSLTHEKNSPWYETVKSKNGTLKKNEHIPNEVILKYYKEKLNDKSR